MPAISTTSLESAHHRFESSSTASDDHDDSPIELHDVSHSSSPNRTPSESRSSEDSDGFVEIAEPKKEAHVGVDSWAQNNGSMNGKVWSRGDASASSRLCEKSSYKVEEYPDAPWYTSVLVCFSYAVMIILSKFADWLRKKGYFKVPKAQEHYRQKDFAPLKGGFESLYLDNLYRIACDVMNRPLASVPGAIMTLRDRTTYNHGWQFVYTGTTSEVLNMGSYNYLGFSSNSGPCADAAAKAITADGLATCATRHEFGMTKIQHNLEKYVAEYLGTESALCFPMGFGTNSMNIPCLVEKGCLILSDELNHASLVLGCRMSGASIKVFKHNNAKDLERQIRNAIVAGQPKSGKPYKKIMIIVEGIYSMEGTIVHLPDIIAVKKKYGAYLFLDEAHSVGALGPSGKGVVEYWGCDPADVDIMMGTLTKSFAAAGGYIAGRKRTIEHIRAKSQGCCYGTTMSAPVIAQVSSSMQIMLGHDGTDEGSIRTQRLARNTRYFRQRLRNMGFLIYGHDDSPVIPLMTFFVTKVVCFGRETLKRNLGVVSVGAPATPLTKSRARFCISASHTKEQLDKALEIVSEIGDVTRTKYGRVNNTEIVAY
uniref:Aminotransferase class I/classII domain-containing protein n=2 Tax=Plectus sambesii TaxID=2011161 RepID=A0A914XF82_9BILA